MELRSTIDNIDKCETHIWKEILSDGFRAPTVICLKTISDLQCKISIKIFLQRGWGHPRCRGARRPSAPGATEPSIPWNRSLFLDPWISILWGAKCWFHAIWVGRIDWVTMRQPYCIFKISPKYLVFEGDCCRQEAFSREVHWLPNAGVQVRLVAKSRGQVSYRRFGLVWFRLAWFGLVWFGLAWFGLVIKSFFAPPLRFRGQVSSE